MDIKILIYTLYIPNGLCGISNHARQLVSHLKEKGIDITVCTSDLLWTKSDILNQHSKKLLIFKQWNSSKADFSPELFLYFKRYVKKFDIIQLSGIFNFPTIFGAYEARAAGIPYIVMCEGYSVPSMMPYAGSLKKHLFYWFLGRKVLKKSQMVVCSNQGNKEIIHRQLSVDNVVYIPYGLDYLPYTEQSSPDVIRERLGINPDRPIFLLLGRLSQEKAIPFLLDMWELFVKEVPEAYLVIAGPAGFNKRYTKKIASRIAQSNYAKTVLLPGAVTGDLKYALLQHSRSLLLPSYFESFSNVVLEALASGIPVIASAGTPWSVLEEKRLGRWLGEWDIELWKKALTDILRDKYYESQNFKEVSRQWVIDNFNWSNVADQYIDIYKKILKRN